MFEYNNQKILVTGATGWVGRTFLHELQAVIPPEIFNTNVKALGSKESLIESTNYSGKKRILIPIEPLTNLQNYLCEDQILVFHAAFLTRNWISEYGLNPYIDANQQITKTVTNFLERCKSSRVIAISSGAAKINEGIKNSQLGLTTDPYGFLKLTEEKQISKIAETQVLRIYGLTGRFIRYPEIYALGDLLRNAKRKKPLIIRSSNPVIRSYVNASDVAKSAINWLLSSDKASSPIGASSYITTLTRLAEKIAKIFDLPPPIVSSSSGNPDSYSCSPVEFEKMLRKFRIKPLNFNDQIIDTAKGIKA